MVAKHPTIYLSNKDQKRKPTKEEITRLMSNHRSYAEFTLCPGDSLYIPRGFIHNASTVDFDQLNNEPMNDCSYPEGLISSQSLIDRLSGPSLHLTFGLEQGCEGTIEALLHHTMDAYFSNTKLSDSHILPHCNATWIPIMHFSLGEVARMKHECDDSSSNETMTHHCSGHALLRQSVQLFENDSHLFDLKAFYEKSLKLIYELSDITRTLKFMQSEKVQSKEADLTFCYPNMPYPNSIPCVDEVLDVSDALQNHYQQIIQEFSSYASMNFETALQRMKLHQKKLFEESQHKEQTNKQ